jgi:hypothetical protein
MADLGLGRDTSCTDSLRTGRFVTGAQLVAESDYRRLTTPRGMLRGGEEDQNFGLDLTERIGTSSTNADAISLPGEIRAELMKDDRHESVAVTVTQTKEGPAIGFVITVEGQTADGPYTLTLLATEVTVELLGIKADA